PRATLRGAPCPGQPAARGAASVPTSAAMPIPRITSSPCSPPATFCLAPAALAIFSARSLRRTPVLRPGSTSMGVLARHRSPARCPRSRSTSPGLAAPRASTRRRGTSGRCPGPPGPPRERTCPSSARTGLRSSERRLLVKIFGRQRAVGLDIGAGVVRALVLEGTPGKTRITGTAGVSIAGGGGTATAQAIHAALAQAHADGEPVVAAVGGPDVVVRQLTLPPLPPDRVLQALELQHKEFGLLPSSEGLLDAQVLRRSKKNCLVLAVSAPKPVVEGRLRLLEQAAV